MAISSAGIGSGLDVASLVTQLVAAERSPAEGRLTRLENKAKTTLSALGVFKSVAASLQSAVNALKGTGSTLGKLTTLSSKPELFTATAANGSVASSFSIEILQKAQASKIATAAYASADAIVGSGTVTLNVGSESFAITLTDGDNTLAGLRDKINAATDNKGVTASILNESGGARLILTSKETGLAKAVTLSSAAEVGGASYISTSVVQSALDAQVEIDGFPYNSGSNTITGAIEGVTINLLKAEPGTVANLDITLDSGASSEAVQNLVKAYNTFVAAISQFSRYDAATKTGGPLLGDAMVRTTTQQVRSVLGSSVEGGDVTLLAQLGITTQTDGTLKVDASKLDAAIKADPDGIKNLFGGTGGFATRLSTVLDGVLGPEGRLQAQTKGLQGRVDDVGDARDALDLRMAAVERRYRAQFTALDSLLGTLSTTSNYLAQQLGNLPGTGN